MKKKPWEQSHIDRADPRKADALPPLSTKSLGDWEDAASFYSTLVQSHSRKHAKTMGFAALYGSNGVTKGNGSMSLDDYLHWGQSPIDKLVDMATAMVPLQTHIRYLQSNGLNTEARMKDFCKDPTTKRWVGLWAVIRDHPHYRGHLNRKVLTLMKAMEYQS